MARIVSDIARVDISGLMDDIYQASYGGSVDLLLGYPTLRPEVLFESETEIVLSNWQC